MDDFKKYFTYIQFEKIHRVQNKAADAMAMIGSLIDMPKDWMDCEFLVEQLLILAYDVYENKIVCNIIGLESPWYHDIYAYLHDNILPLDLTWNQHKSSIQCTSQYTIMGDTLYHRGYDGTLLQCLIESKSHVALNKVHSGVCGSHSNGMKLEKKILRAGYY